VRCEFSDGLRVSYAGRLRINKGSEIDVFLEPDDIPEDIRGELYDATLSESCNGLRHAAQEVIDIFGTKLPE
jgi:hypothetical protein